MNIRERNHGDDLALVDIWLRSVRATHAFLTEKDIQALYPQVLNVRLPAVRVWVCEDEAGEIAGFIGLKGNKVDMLFVDASKRGKGAGRRLLNFALAARLAASRRERAESASHRLLPALRLRRRRPLGTRRGRPALPHHPHEAGGLKPAGGLAPRCAAPSRPDQAVLPGGCARKPARDHARPRDDAPSRPSARRDSGPSPRCRGRTQGMQPLLQHSSGAGASGGTGGGSWSIGVRRGCS